MNPKIRIPAILTFRKLLYNKKVTIPFSIVMAFVLWLIIMINQKPDMDRTFTGIPVNINLENTFVTDNGMEIIGDVSDQNFTVTVRGPSYVVAALKAGDLSVFASAATVNDPGEYDLDVAGAKNSDVTEYEILSVSPKTVKVTFDYVDTEEFSIKAKADGVSAAEGLIAENSAVSGTDKDTLTIKGPRTVVNKIETVVAYAEVNKTLSASETFDATIKLYDKENAEIDAKNLTLSATKVKVTVPISKKVTVPVVADFTNLPSGFLKESIAYSINHSSVTVIGKPETIEKTTAVVLSPIDITNITKTANSFDVSAKLPDGVRLLDTIDHFTVTIDTSGYTERTFTVTNIKYTGLSSSLTASGGAEIKNVSICGPKSVMSKLKAELLYAEIDLSDKKAGENTVLATIKSDLYNNIWQIGTYSTTVVIK